MDPRFDRRLYTVEGHLGGRASALRFPNANLTGEEMGTRIRNNWNRILAHIHKPGPYAYAILPRGFGRRWPAKG